jgi:hypothetical protein
LLTFGREVHRILLFFQTFADELREVQIVFNQQYAHGLCCSHLPNDRQARRSAIDRTDVLTDTIMAPLNRQVTQSEVGQDTVERLGTGSFESYLPS